jgi:hypothetical protein
MAQPAKQRKRDAVGNLRDLAEELGVAVEVRRSLGQKRRSGFTVFIFRLKFVAGAPAAQ